MIFITNLIDIWLLLMVQEILLTINILKKEVNSALNPLHGVFFDKNLSCGALLKKIILRSW